MRTKTRNTAVSLLKITNKIKLYNYLFYTAEATSAKLDSLSKTFLFLKRWLAFILKPVSLILVDVTPSLSLVTFKTKKRSTNNNNNINQIKNKIA